MLKTLALLDWAVEVGDDPLSDSPRHVLLIDPERTALAPLAQALMLPRAPSVQALWQGGTLADLRVADVLAQDQSQR